MGPLSLGRHESSGNSRSCPCSPSSRQLHVPWGRPRQDEHRALSQPLHCVCVHRARLSSCAAPLSLALCALRARAVRIRKLPRSLRVLPPLPRQPRATRARHREGPTAHAGTQPALRGLRFARVTLCPPRSRHPRFLPSRLASHLPMQATPIARLHSVRNGSARWMSVSCRCRPWRRASVSSSAR